MNLRLGCSGYSSLFCKMPSKSSMSVLWTCPEIAMAIMCKAASGNDLAMSSNIHVCRHWMGPEVSACAVQV